MRLFGNNLNEIRFLKNKFNQFKIFNKCKIPVIDTIRISSPEQGKKFNFPALIKPVDASAAKGVFLVKTFKELKKKFIESLRFSKKKHLLLQKYLRGKELGAEVIVQNKKIKGIYLTDKTTSKIPYFVVMGHEMPAQLTKDQKKIIHDTLLKIVKTSLIKNSMINFDLILVNNIVYVIEFGPRLGGNFLPLLVKLAGGGDNYKKAIKMALGMPTINYPCRNFSSIMYFNVRKEGTLTKIKYDEKLHRFTENLKFFKKEGNSVKPVSEVNDRIGYFIVKAKNRYELKEKIKKVKHAVRFYLK
jgi:carbamoyl-phosphate synthase large subunit